MRTSSSIFRNRFFKEAVLPDVTCRTASTTEFDVVSDGGDGPHKPASALEHIVGAGQDGGGFCRVVLNIKIKKLNYQFLKYVFIFGGKLTGKIFYK